MRDSVTERADRTGNPADCTHGVAVIIIADACNLATGRRLRACPGPIEAVLKYIPAEPAERVWGSLSPTIGCSRSRGDSSGAAAMPLG
jgi:hypothetical protein